MFDPLHRLLGAAADATLVLSYDRTGFRRHQARFVPGDLDVDLGGRVALVTGANSGIGFETARALATRGARVWLACRNRERGETARGILARETGADVRLALLDVSDLGAVRGFASTFEEARLDILVNNAGVLPDTRQHSPQGHEVTFATNVLGPHLLTRGLLGRLEAAGAGRAVTVSSGGMYSQRLDLDRLRGEGPEAFDGVVAYAQTKRAQVILTELMAERWGGRGVTFNAMHPGWADTPAVKTSLPRFHAVTRALLRSPAEGADTVVWLAICPRINQESGRFWFDREVRRTHYAPWTREDPASREGLWALCERLVDAA